MQSSVGPQTPTELLTNAWPFQRRSHLAHWQLRRRPRVGRVYDLGNDSTQLKTPSAVTTA
jgi:hypothetical protein